MNIVITGSLGNIGSPLCKELIEKRHSLTVISSNADKNEADRLGVASNSLVNSVNARRIGWNPKGPSLEKYFSEITL